MPKSRTSGRRGTVFAEKVLDKDYHDALSECDYTVIRPTPGEKTFSDEYLINKYGKHIIVTADTTFHLDSPNIELGKGYVVVQPTLTKEERPEHVEKFKKFVSSTTTSSMTGKIQFFNREGESSLLKKYKPKKKQTA